MQQRHILSFTLFQDFNYAAQTEAHLVTTDEKGTMLFSAAPSNVFGSGLNNIRDIQASDSQAALCEKLLMTASKCERIFSFLEYTFFIGFLYVVFGIRACSGGKSLLKKIHTLSWAMIWIASFLPDCEMCCWEYPDWNQPTDVLICTI